MQFLDMLLNSPFAVIVLTILIGCLLAYIYYVALPIQERKDKLEAQNAELQQKLLEQGETIKEVLPELKKFIDTGYKDSLHSVTESIIVLQESVAGLKDTASETKGIMEKIDTLRGQVDRMESIVNKHPNNLESELTSLMRSVQDVHEECHELIRRYDSMTGLLIQRSAGQFGGQPMNLEGLK